MNQRIEMYRKEGDDLRRQVTELKVQMLTWENNLCYMSNCKDRILIQNVEDKKKNGNKSKKSSQKK